MKVFVLLLLCCTVQLLLFGAEARILFVRDVNIVFQSLWQNGGCDAICGKHNAVALRVTSAALQQELDDAMKVQSIDRAYLGARYTTDSQPNAWVWMGDNWTLKNALPFYLGYSIGASVGYTNWAPFNPPLLGDIPIISPLLSPLLQPMYVQNSIPDNGWIAAFDQKYDYVACYIDDQATVSSSAGTPRPTSNNTSGSAANDEQSTDSVIEPIQTSAAGEIDAPLQIIITRNPAIATPAFWKEGALDKTCALFGAKAMRINSAATEAALKDKLNQLQSDLVYIGGMYRSDLTPQGWVWMGDDWTTRNAVLFYQGYSGGPGLGYTNWAVNNPPVNGDTQNPPLVYLQYSRVANGWVAAPSQLNDEVACYIEANPDTSTSQAGGSTTSGSQVVLVTDPDITTADLWNNGALATVCARRGGTPLRVTSSDTQTQLLAQMRRTNVNRMYIGGMYRSDLTPQGWVWMGDDWTTRNAVLFYQGYSGGPALGYTNWAANNPPVNGDTQTPPLVYLQYSRVANGWVAAPSQLNIDIVCYTGSLNEDT